MDEANKQLLDAISSMSIMQKMMIKFDERHANDPIFKVFRQYMSMVRAVRTANWNLHLQALELFTKYFFAHDRLNYARMIPVYLAEMKSLQKSDPDIYSELLDGN